ncbi:RDD family protein [Carboxylicivirga sp. A043]|uniref:RDD family protein n=1 Tax=Carboxylicivirga litoralis TaxID=2816963 RepID=UPI0021CB7924|nr:RDD family protein [Carboxylicivirga sp. A043]MCU4154830.1 RDD family protein [Carboxylicivirga sp. A043]
MENLSISTTQNVDIDYQLASVGDRIAANLIDGFIKLAYGIVFSLFTFGLSDAEPQWWLGLIMLPVVFYNLLCDLFLSGQTFGKMMMKIRVVKLDGGELNFGACFIRWVFRLVDISFTYGVCAMLTVIIGGKGQRVGDIAAKTTVLKINPKGSLSGTAYVELEEGYEPKYPEVSLLSDSDLQTIKEVLLIASKDRQYNSIGAPHPLVLKTKEVVIKKMKIETKEPSREFLNTVLKDYNYYHQ